MDDAELAVFVILLSKAPVRVLTILHEGEWHLPRFTYDTSCEYRSAYCVRDLEAALDSSSRKFRFDVVAELFPRDDNSLSTYPNPDGLNRLTLVQTKSDQQLDYELPSNARWSDVGDVIAVATEEYLDYFYYYVGGAVYLFLKPYTEPDACLSDPRAAERWTHRAVEYLLSVVRALNLKVTSEVTRVAWTSSSELFRVNTCQGWYYLKAPPPGCEEVAVTRHISDIFPEETLQVVAISESLNCFVAKGVHRVLEMSTELHLIMVNKLARVQRKSLQHLTELKALGLPEYSAAVLGTKIEEWVLDPAVAEVLREENVATQKLTCTLKKVCDRMARSAIPLALVHGDFAARNFGKRDDVVQDQGYILYDWQLACITHPFCDFYFYENRTRAWEEYRKHWLDYVTEREADVEMTLAVPMSRMAQMGMVMDARELGGSRPRDICESRLANLVANLVVFARLHAHNEELYE